MSKQLYPLTGPQKNFWHSEQANQYNKNLNVIYSVMKLPEDTDLKILDQTFNKIKEINDALRLRFIINDCNELVQYVEDYEYKPSRIIYTDSEEIDEVIENEKTDILSITGKVNELAIIKTPLNCFVLYKSHHILTDGWGMTKIADQIKEIYYMLENNVDVSDYKSASYLDFISRDVEYTKSSKFARDINFWSKIIKNIEPCTIFQNNNIIDKSAKRYEQKIPTKICEKIEEYCKKYKITEYSFFLGIISIYFYHIYNINNFAIGTPFLNRQKRFGEFEETGLHISTLPLPIHIDPNSEFVQLCRDINSSNLSLYKHGSFPYYNIQKMFNEDTKVNSSLYEIGFSYQINVSEKKFNSKAYNKDVEKNLLSDGIGECTWLFSGAQNNTITFHLTQLNAKKIFAIDYLTSVFTDKQIQKIYETIFYLIEQATENDIEISAEQTPVCSTEQPFNSVCIKDFSIATPSDISVLKKFNNTGNIEKIDKNIIDYLEEIVQKHPKKTALICDNQKMSYKEFYDKVGILVDAIISKNVKPNSPIVLLFDKSFDMFISLFAVLKAGCYYVPILPDENKDRIKYIINDCQPACILTHKNYVNLVSKFGIDCINLDDVYCYDTTDSFQISIKDKHIKPSNIAYTIYTSGSTGKPKGVQVMHKNIISLIESMKRDSVLKPTYSDVSMSLLKYSFDASGIDIYSSLLCGGTLLIIGKDDELNPVKVLELIEKYRVTRSFLVPKWIENIVATSFNYNFDLSSLKLLGTGGEVLKLSILKDFLNKYSNIKIVNLYGPTETTMFTTFKVISDNMIAENYSTIGKPIFGSRIAILNENNMFLPINCNGELVVYEDDTSIKNIAYGYFNLDEQTTKKFVKIYNPITQTYTDAYKTGDIAKINDDLEIEFIGRNDDMVKVNGGYLVSINEIEKNISHLLGENIESFCVAVPYKNSKTIVMFFNNNEKNISNTQIKAYLKEHLSFYMQPHKIIELSEIPRTLSGKVDRQTLKKIALEELKLQNNNILKPRTDLEFEIYNIVKNLVHIDDFSITDDFFDDLGIDSLTLTSVYVALSNYKMNLQDLYTNSNVQDLAQFIENKCKSISMDIELNEIEKFDTINNENGESFDISTVLLTGVTGFLGIHILHSLLLNKKVKKIYCIIRNKIGIDASERLYSMIDFYYNSNKKLLDLIAEKVVILNGEITKPNFNLADDTYHLLQNCVKTVINCAANVKHFSKPDQMRNDNIVSVDNIIEFCGDKISLAHISTLSIAGFKNRYTIDKIFDENTLYIKQGFNNNPYLISKFNAEKHILEAISSKGLHCKIFRLGNIMPRKDDGMFQKNANQNIFINAIKALLNLQVVPEEMLDLKLEFSPVDECASAIVKLLSDNSNVIYHILNNNEISVKKIIDIFQKKGYLFNIVSMYKFTNALNSLDDKYVKEYILGTNLNKFSQKKSLNCLKNQDFLWSKITEDYIFKIIEIAELAGN